MIFSFISATLFEKKVKRLVGLVLLGLLASCAEFKEDSATPYQLSKRSYLYNARGWSFQGRLALVDDNQSITASIAWVHYDDVDEIQLAGPFGQGRTIVKMTADSVVVDNGDRRIKYQEDINNLVARHTGISVPVSALKYWVLGLVDPENQFVNSGNGFVQSGWSVNFLQMQTAGQHDMPRKLNISKDKTRLKLIINQWRL